MTTRSKNIITHVGIILLMLVISCIYFAPALQGKVILQGDIQKSDAMGYEQNQYHAKTGEYTNWNSSMFSGMPGYGTPQHSVFSTLKSILILRPIGLERNIGVLFLYLIGFYVALLALGCNAWLALLGSVAFALGSYNIVIVEAGHITKAWAISMMAPILASMVGCFRALKDDRRTAFAWCAILFTLSLGLQITFNHVQITYYTMIGGVLLGLTYMVYALKERYFKSFLLGVGVLLLGCAFAVGANARLLMVNQEYMQATMRGGSELTVTPNNAPKETTSNGLDVDYAFNWSYGIGETYTLLVPGAMGGGSIETVDNESASYQTFHQNQVPLYWGDQAFTSGPVYFGAIIIFLFILGLLVVKGPERWWLLAAALISILLSWGHNFMAFNEFVFNNLPLYNKFRTPSMSLVLASVAMVLMGVLALKAIFSRRNDATLKIKLAIATGITAATIVVGMLLCGGFSFSGAADQQMAAQYGNQWSSIQDVFIRDRKALFLSDSWRSLIFVLLAAGVIWLYHTGRLIKKPGWVVALLLILCTVDLWNVDRRYLNDKNFVSARSVELHPDPWDSDIDAQAAHFGDQDYRVLNLAVNTFNDSKPSAFHHQVGGYSAIKLRRYQDIIEFYLSGSLNMNVLNMLNTRYVVVPGGQVQRNPEALGSAWFVDECKAVADADAEILALGDINPARTAIVDTSKFKIAPFTPDSAATIAMQVATPYNPDHLTYTTQSSTPQMAVFSEVYYGPDWRAYVDGQPADHIRCNYILRAMFVPAGSHTIEFVNEAPSVHKWNKVSIFVSIAMIIAMACGLWVVYRKNKKNK